MRLKVIAPLVIIITSLIAISAKAEKAEDPTVRSIQTTTTSTTTTLSPEVKSYLKTVKVEQDRNRYGVCGEWHDTAIRVGWDETVWSQLQQVIWRESRCQADAWNGADAGLLQVNVVHRAFVESMGLTFPEGMFVAEHNLRLGLSLWKGSCWKHWRFSGTTFDCENKQG